MFKNRLYVLLFVLFLGLKGLAQIACQTSYLEEIKKELTVKWPNNRTVNIVFHGHSVPSGYFTGGNVNTLQSYPFLTLKYVKELYPFAVVNSITTSIGGENAVKGEKRFTTTVLNHKPDVLFIDYGLNDRWTEKEIWLAAWENMVQAALNQNIKVILMTPTPDLTEDILSGNAPLTTHSNQIRKLAEKYKVGLIDSYSLFKEIAKNEDLKKYMAQNNHINEIGHEVVAAEIIKWFR